MSVIQKVHLQKLELIDDKFETGMLDRELNGNKKFDFGDHLSFQTMTFLVQRSPLAQLIGDKHV